MDAINSVFEVFGLTADWVVENLPKLTQIFYTTSETGGDLTVLGVLGVASLGVGVTMLAFNYVKDFFKFR